ncbi:response regulator [Tepidibacillus marianensis]|uniref:response regulator n=1 Tax=Tepidibacillus marianensis TaxID=3131995 RepID=UPI0030CDAE56
MYRVLIIEDDYRIAEINKGFVEQVKGFQVVGVALNGKTAKQMITNYGPDLVLLDVYIPDISGKELFSFIKESHPNTDVITITAAKEVSTLEFFLRYGVFDYLIKPIRMERLHHSLTKYHTYKEKLKKEVELDQQEIDSIMEKTFSMEHKDYPKGIDPLTLERVRRFIVNQKTGLTAEEIGKQLGISRSTARRYVEYLVHKEEIMADLRYGTVGRPERVYGPLVK